MEAGHAGPASAPTSWVERATILTCDEIFEKAMQARLENSLQSAEDKVATDGGIDDEREVMWHEVLGERIAFDPRECCETTDGAVRVGMQERDQVSPDGLWILLRRPG